MEKSHCDTQFLGLQFLLHLNKTHIDFKKNNKSMDDMDDGRKSDRNMGGK